MDNDNKNTQGADVQAPVKEETTNTESKTFTQEDLDRIASKTRAEEKERAEKAIEKAKAEAVAEAERRAKLSEEERQKEFESQKEKQIQERERELTLRENKADAIEKLSELQIPTKFVDFLIDHDKDKMSERIDNFSKEFKKAVTEEVAKQTKSGAPRDPKNPVGSETKEVQNYF